MEYSSIKKNLVFSTLYQVLIIIAPLITAPYLSRVLGAEGIGIYSYTSSIETYFVLFAALGTAEYGKREISRNREDAHHYSKIFWEIELLTVATTAICLLFWCQLIFFSGEYRIYYVALTMPILAVMFDVSWLFAGLEMFKLTVSVNAVVKLLSVVSVFVFVKTADDVHIYVIITSLTALASNVLLWPSLRKVLVKVQFNELNVRQHVKQTFIFFVPTIAVSIYTVLDRTLLGVITHDNAENGFYRQAEQIVNLEKGVVFSAINSVVGTRSSFLFASHQYEEIRSKIEESLNYIFFMGFGCCFGTMAIAKTFVPIFFGDGFASVNVLLYILCPIVVIIGISNCLGANYYTPAGKREKGNLFLIIGSGVNLCLNCLLIPHLGAIGAAIASVIAETAITVLYCCNCEDYMDLQTLSRCSWRKISAGLIMFVAVYHMNEMAIGGILKLIIQIACGIAVYVLSLVVLKDSWTKKCISDIYSHIFKRKK